MKLSKSLLSKSYVSLLLLFSFASKSSFATVVNTEESFNNVWDFFWGWAFKLAMAAMGWGVIQLGLGFRASNSEEITNGIKWLIGGAIIGGGLALLGLV